MNDADDWQGTALRLGVFVACFAAVAAWETLARWRPAVRPRRRWPLNLGLMVLGALLVRIALPVAATGVALLAARHGIGLLNAVEAPAALEMVVAVVLLDLAIYGQHVLSHAWRPLWRLHRVHHADTEFDVSTGVRFHPVEILLSMLFKMAAVLATGAPPAAVLAFEVLLSAGALFTHAAASLPRRADRLVRWLFVTPDMHRVHHSRVRRETDSNYGFHLSIWDRLFGTYRDAPALGRDGVEIGLGDVAASSAARLRWCITSPFTREAGRRAS